ncbi:unnamed protein product [Prunus armeniaca]|uniref:Uncharacterized protein n=1 Tax=Prunus armeniaca TaxID=36596 RepID=A0A6J5X509_PRUAR|nr:unnamed protein product [Prunus armeniaca]
MSRVKKQRKWASLGVAGRTDLCKRKRTNSWVAEKNESIVRGPKVNRRTEEQKKEVEDKLKMVEKEKKELTYKVGELGKQKRLSEGKRIGQ